MVNMSNINASAEAARENARQAGGQFGNQEHTAPESQLTEQKPLTDQIADYLSDYDDARSAYERDGGGYGPDADEAYEVWEDFQTDHSGDTYAMLEASKAEIERLQAELAAERTKHAIPQALADAIEQDRGPYEERLLYVPEDGHVGGYVDVIAVSDGVPRKYTYTPEGEIERNFS